MRRQMFALVAVGACFLPGLPAARAQDATPAAASAFADLGSPELTVTMTDGGLQVDQAEIAAGRHLVHFVSEADNPDASAGFLRLTGGKTLADLSLADEAAAGTSLPDEDTRPDPAGDAWLYETSVTGAGSVFSPDVVIDLQGGDFGVRADDPASPIAAAALTVTGDPDAAIGGPEPDATVTITEHGKGGNGFDFMVEGGLVAGTNVVKIENPSAQPRFVLGWHVPEPTTRKTGWRSSTSILRPGPPPLLG